MTEATVDVRTDDRRVHIALAGDVDLANADDIQAQISAVIPNRVAAVELDLSEVTYLDSAGLQVVFVLASRLQRLQIALRLVAPPTSPARHALELSGMAGIAPIEPAPPGPPAGDAPG
jgi:anti-anti-sigma factor